MRRWTIPVVALVLALAVGSGAYAQTPSADKMDKDKMMDKKDDKMGGKMDKDKMMKKDKMMDKDKMDKDKMMMDKKDDKMMDKKQ